MKTPKVCFAILVFVVLMSVCEKGSWASQIPQRDRAKRNKSRVFYMGFRPFPHTFTDKATEEAYNFVNEHSDIICHHFDDGIPWEAAYKGKPYHKEILKHIHVKKEQTAQDKKIYVAVAPLFNDRYTLAYNWGKESHMERKGFWKDKTFNDPEVITAYINYCRHIIDELHPDYFNYGVEVSENWKGLEDPNFKDFLIFAEAVYTTLKRAYPDLPIFVSLTHGNSVVNEDEYRKICLRLLEFSDYIATSSYGYLVPGMDNYKDADPNNLPKNFFEAMADLDPSKPFAVAETGSIAENLIIDEYQYHIEGTEEWQAEFLHDMLHELNTLNAEFVIWLMYKDYDEGWKLMKKMGFPDWGKIWKDCGLIDGKNIKREAYYIWKEWLGFNKE
jgi:hypothetical protein